MSEVVAFVRFLLPTHSWVASATEIKRMGPKLAPIKKRRVKLQRQIARDAFLVPLFLCLLNLFYLAGLFLMGVLYHHPVS